MNRGTEGMEKNRIGIVFCSPLGYNIKNVNHP